MRHKFLKGGGGAEAVGETGETHDTAYCTLILHHTSKMSTDEKSMFISAHSPLLPSGDCD